MTYSEIQITFNDSMTYSSYVQFDITNDLTQQTINVNETWKNTRMGFYEVALPNTVYTDSVTANVRSAINFVTAFNLDYNAQNNYEVIRSSNVVIIKSKDPKLKFTNASVVSKCKSYSIDPGGSEFQITYIGINGSREYLDIAEHTTLIAAAEGTVRAILGIFGSIIEGNYLSLDVDFAIDNFDGTALNITQIEFETADTKPNENIKVLISGSEQADNYSIDSLPKVSTSTNPTAITIPRSGRSRVFYLYKDPQNSQITAIVPEVFPSEIRVSHINSPRGATVTITPVEGINKTGLVVFEYSLDNLNWQSGNAFSGIASGNYTVYVRDQYGGSRQQTFSIAEFETGGIGVSDSHFYYSIANPVQMVLNQTATNDTNSLSHQDRAGIRYKETQLFKPTDLLKIQFKSNYHTHEILQKGQSVTSLTADKITDNMGLKETRDGILYKTDSGKIGLYFDSGNIYNDDNTVKESYTLKGGLPAWGVVGNYVFIDSWLEIIQTTFDETLQVEVLILDAEYTDGAEQLNKKVTVLYNKFNYEVYEVAIPLESKACFTLSLKATHDSYETIELHSEKIGVTDDLDDHIELKYKNTTNTDVYFVSGIEFVMHIPFEKIYGAVIDESENHKTDNTTLPLSAAVRQTNVFKLGLLTKNLMWKVVTALSHNWVQIDGENYVKENVEPEESLEDSNLYLVEANMIKTASPFNAEVGVDQEQSATANIEVPALIKSGDGFIRVG